MKLFLSGVANSLGSGFRLCPQDHQSLLKSHIYSRHFQPWGRFWGLRSFVCLLAFCLGLGSIFLENMAHNACLINKMLMIIIEVGVFPDFFGEDSTPK